MSSLCDVLAVSTSGEMGTSPTPPLPDPAELRGASPRGGKSAC